MPKLLRWFPLLVLLASVCAQAAETIHLKVMELPDNRHVYYTRLLEESLRAAGYAPRLEFIKNVPQARIWRMTARSELSLMWGVQTSARDHDYASVANSLTNGLVGQRVLLVRKGQEQDYSGVRNLDDFRKLGRVGGMGEGWFDVEVWQLNALPFYVKAGDWRNLFSMVAYGGRGIDYVVRGVNEIVNEATNYPGLAIEPSLVLMHDRDVRFYLSPKAARYKPVIEAALAQADRSGLKKKLIAQYILPDLKVLNLEKRLKLKLNTPAP